MNGGKVRRTLTAAAAIAEKERRLRNDPAYRAEVEAAEASRRAIAEALTKAELPIVQDLAEVGVHVDSVWDLVDTSEPYPEALPVLMRNLERGGYPDRVLESLARALAVGPAAEYWTRLRTRYLRAVPESQEEEGLVVALAAVVTRDHLDDLIDLALDHKRGSRRLLFLDAIRRLGGQRGWAVLESLASDALLGHEARALLAAGAKRR